MWDKKPMLTVVPKCELDVVPVKAPSISVPPPVPPKSGGTEICLWDLSPSTLLRIKINFALNVTAPQMSVSVFALIVLYFQILHCLNYYVQIFSLLAFEISTITRFENLTKVL